MTESVAKQVLTEIHAIRNDMQRIADELKTSPFRNEVDQQRVETKKRVKSMRKTAPVDPT